MTTPLPLGPLAAVPGTADPRTTAGARRAGQLARVLLGHALLVGVAADLLLRDAPSGVAFPLWVAVVALAAVSLVWRAGARVGREAAAWLAIALLASLGLAWRDGGMLQFLDFVTAMGALAMAAIATNDASAGLFARRLRDTAWGALRLGVQSVDGMPTLVARARADVRSRRAATGSRSLVRAGVLAAVLLVVFGSLLRDADPIFASLVSLPDVDVGEAISHLVLVGAAAWVAAGWAKAAVLAEPATSRSPALAPFELGKAEVVASLGTLGVLFALFVLSQLGWMFGGEAFLRARTGLTAAEYARGGFFQMLGVVALAVPVVVATRSMLAPSRQLARTHTMLALPVLVLLGGIIASALLRMQLYVHYYGLTVDRFYPLVFIGWAALLLPWLALTVLRDWGQPFVGGAAIAGLVLLGGLNVVSPDALVARVNVARAAELPASTSAPLDLAHLASLSGEAVDVAVRATLAPRSGVPGTAQRSTDDAARCAASSTLLGRWGPVSGAATRAESDWRGWNAGRRRALRIVGENAAALRALRHETCRGRASVSR